MNTINLLYQNLFHKHTLKPLYCIYVKWNPKKAETMRSISIYPHIYTEASHLWNLFTIWEYHIWRSKARCAVDLTSVLNLLFTCTATSWYVLLHLIPQTLIAFDYLYNFLMFILYFISVGKILLWFEHSSVLEFMQSSVSSRSLLLLLLSIRLQIDNLFNYLLIQHT